MSTRALIGKENEDGTITAAWCWNDGKDIKKNLVKDFTKNEDLEFLLSLGEFSTIMTKAGMDDFIHFCENTLHCDLKDKEFINHNKSFVLKEKHHENKPKVYSDLDEASGQDINVMYIMKNEQWLEYTTYPASKETPKNLTEQQAKRKGREK